MLTNAQVRELQAALNAKGQPVSIDGDFGPQTEEAVYAVLLGKAVPSPPPLPHRPQRWPTQGEADTFYGNPRGGDGNESEAWKRANLVTIKPPYKVTFGPTPMEGLRIHRKCADSALRVLNVTWEKCGKDQAKIDALNISKFSGSFNYRPIRNGNRLSMHSYGCAWDWDAPDNMLGDKTPFFGFDHPLVVAHLEEGWIWGADWDGDHDIRDSSPVDGMHFQAARIK